MNLWLANLCHEWGWRSLRWWLLELGSIGGKGTYGKDEGSHRW
jgi:hypothetical protein